MKATIKTGLINMAMIKMDSIEKASISLAQKRHSKRTAMMIGFNVWL